MTVISVKQNYDLTQLNTLGVSARAREFIEINNEKELRELFTLLEFKQNKKIFLGGGSNVLFIKDFDGIVVLNKLEGIEILKEDSDNVIIRSMSGVLWHDLVSFTTEHGYWGIENLSLIPGTVGGAPVQNIGAYGAELKDVLVQVETYSVLDGTKYTFEKEECEFDYRDSVFKSRLKGQYFISAIILKLSKIPNPNLSYKILREYLEQPTRTTVQSGGNKIVEYSPKDISDAVAAIRRSKLPDPNIISNAGSFFKNVFVDVATLQNLLTHHPSIKYFKEGEKIKIPAGWLIEQCGPASQTSWKGYRVGNVGVHTEHALVLVNYGGGTGEDLKNLAEEITSSVFSKFGLKLTPEVNLI